MAFAVTSSPMNLETSVPRSIRLQDDKMEMCCAVREMKFEHRTIVSDIENLEVDVLRTLTSHNSCLL
jgi:hypothetical protein